MKNCLLDIFNKHQVWIDIVSSFGCNKETAEDIVQEMYIKIDKKIKNGLNIDFGETDYNYYYIFKTLKTLFLDLKRKESKVQIKTICSSLNFSSSSAFNRAFKRWTSMTPTEYRQRMIQGEDLLLYEYI